MLTAVFLPKQLEVDARPLQFADKRRPVGLRPPPDALLHAGTAEQSLLQRGVGELAWQWPTQPGRRSPLQIVLNRTARGTNHPADLARTDAIMGQPQQLSSHRQLSLRRHPPLLVRDHEGTDARGADLPKTTQSPGHAAGDYAETGRLQFGMVAAIKSERWPTSPRKTRPTSIGNCRSSSSERNTPGGSSRPSPRPTS